MSFSYSIDYVFHSIEPAWRLLTLLQFFLVIPANPRESGGRAGIHDFGGTLDSRFSLRLIRPLADARE
jgi:hypothetical protein